MSQSADGRRYWWVNHKQTYRQEIAGSYLWSPKTKANGTSNHSYDNMVRVAAGDIVFSFAGAAIRAVGVATGTAESYPKPNEFGKAGEAWGDDGWRLPVEFRELTKPLSTQANAEAIAPMLPEKYSPIRSDGKGNQGIYLAQISADLAETLDRLIGGQIAAIEATIQWTESLEGEAEEEEKAVNLRTDIGPTQKQQLVKARRGQGVFRDNLARIERGCRVTKVTQKSLLRASHIKPWSKSSDYEKLDGYNGLWLAPHLDLLFDQGWISFSDTGEMLISPRLDRAVLSNWAIDSGKNYGMFAPEQCQYLMFHREHLFRR